MGDKKEENKPYNRVSNSRRVSVIEALVAASHTIRMLVLMAEGEEEAEAGAEAEVATINAEAEAGVAVGEVGAVGMEAGVESRSASNSRKATAHEVPNADLPTRPVAAMAVDVVEVEVAVGAVVVGEEVVIEVEAVAAEAAAVELVSPFRRANVLGGIAVNILTEVILDIQLSNNEALPSHLFVCFFVVAKGGFFSFFFLLLFIYLFFFVWVDCMYFFVCSFLFSFFFFWPTSTRHAHAQYTF